MESRSELATFLDRHEISQAEVARALGVSESAISYVIAGRNQLRVERVTALLAFLRNRTGADVTFEQLFGAELSAAEESPASPLPPAANDD